MLARDAGHNVWNVGYRPGIQDVVLGAVAELGCSGLEIGLGASCDDDFLVEGDEVFCQRSANTAAAACDEGALKGEGRMGHREGCEAAR